MSKTTNKFSPAEANPECNADGGVRQDFAPKRGRSELETCTGRLCRRPRG